MNIAMIMASMFVRLFLVPAPVLVLITTVNEPDNASLVEEITPTPMEFLVMDSIPVPSVTPTILPTRIPIVRPTVIPPTKTPMPTVRPTATPTPTPIPVVSLFDLVNKWRRDTGRKEFQESTISCSVADERLPEVVRVFSHDGFTKMMPRLFDTYPNLHKISENLASAPSAQAALAGWLKSSGHRKNLEQDIPYMCIRSKGRIFVQVFTDA